MIKRFAFLIALSMSLMGCSTFFGTPASNNHVELAKGASVTLPTPAEFGSSVSVSQLINADWESEAHTLPVHLEISSERVVLVGFSAWGTRLITATYQDGGIEEDALAGLGIVLPDSRQILMNLMIALWPVEAWAPHLKPIGWTLIEQDKHRILRDASGETVVEIQYDDPFRLGTVPAFIQYEHKQQHYRITINTLSPNGR
ncbi:DUF3261 domain-containing protein [Enterovibrio norvegicus]|uniref:DUF3261 domain-containing protein n=1 Tax=Enterovibrio norvegicus TaxID=188144 RepID=UPI000C825FCC|nr:DUF3261 domain-containing protein [Enterovibrio norvegicus]PMN69271.1 hypothetical protein BCT27_21325 [Enterovibrio norvegicus]